MPKTAAVADLRADLTLAETDALKAQAELTRAKAKFWSSADLAVTSIAAPLVTLISTIIEEAKKR